MTIKNPHDKFTREIFSDPKRIKEIIQNTLPNNIIEKLNLNQIKFEKDSFVEENLKELYTDLLFSIKTRSKKNIKIYILFEHKSKPSKYIHLQLLKYLAQIYGKMDTLTPVIPLILYHGQKKWNIQKSFYSQFPFSENEMKFFKEYIPDFKYDILDLQDRDIDSLIMSLTVKVISYTLKNIWNLESKEILHGLINLAQDLFYDSRGLEIIRKLLIYIYNAKEIEPEFIRDEIARLVPHNKGEIAMTTADLLEKKGMEKGMEKTVINMHKEGLSLDTIQKVTGLSEKRIQKIIGNG